MRKESTTAVLLTVLFSISFAHVAGAAWPVLNQKEVDKFVETFPGMYREVVELGLRIDPQKGKVDGAWKLKRDQKVKRILAENGWDFMFWPRLQAIVRGYSLAKYEQAVSEHGENIEKFVNDLKKSAWMTPEKRAELEAFYAQLKTGFADRAKKLKRQVHQSDLKVVERALPELDSVMNEVIKIEWERALGQLGKHAKANG